MKIRNTLSIITLALTAVMAADAADAADLCATDQEKEQVRAFYDQYPGVLPFTAARRLGMPEAKIVAALPEGWSASAPGSAFAEVWQALSAVSHASFLIAKGGTVFEILSGVSPGAPSTQSRYFNIEYLEPVRGHLRPDEYAAIYAIDYPGPDSDSGVRVQAVLFYDREGEPVFGVFVSGEALTTTEENKAHFASVKKLIAAGPSICAAPKAE